MVSLQEFVAEVAKENQFLQDGATMYRKQTAALSVQVLQSVQEVAPFLTRETSLQVVSDVLKSFDEDRQADVAKMLHVILTDLTTRTQFTDEFKAKLAERRKNRTNISLVLTK